MGKWEPTVFKTYLITPKGDEAPFEIIGEQIPKDKRDPEIDSGYMFYFKTTQGLQKFSAFHYEAEVIWEGEEIE